MADAKRKPAVSCWVKDKTENAPITGVIACWINEGKISWDYDFRITEEQLVADFRASKARNEKGHRMQYRNVTINTPLYPREQTDGGYKTAPAKTEKPATDPFGGAL